MGAMSMWGWDGMGWVQDGVDRRKEDRRIKNKFKREKKNTTQAHYVYTTQESASEREKRVNSEKTHLAYANFFKYLYNHLVNHDPHNNQGHIGHKFAIFFFFSSKSFFFLLLLLFVSCYLHINFGIM